MALIKFENEDKLFIKFFLLDASINLNAWGVTKSAMLKGLKSFIGKPFVLTPDYSHPTARDGDDLLVQQEKYRVGDIIDVGIEPRTDKAWGIAEITNQEAKDILKNGDVNFVSPSIVFNNDSEVSVGGNAIITEFEGAHVAAVQEPAFSIDKAEIKGRGVGSKESCDLTLQKVEASVSECGNILTVRSAKKTQKELDEDYELQMQSFSKKDEFQQMSKKQKEAFLSMMYNFFKKCQDKNTPKLAEEAHEWGEPHKHPHEVTDREGVTEEKYEKITDEYTSNKQKKSKKTNNMTRKSDETPEDDEVKRGESLEDQYKDREETDILKSEEEEKDDKEAEDDDKDEKEATHKKGEDKEDEEADDTDKLDLTDKQKKFLKDSKLEKQIKILKAELKTLKSKIRRAEVEPLINSILDAKKSVSKIDARAEYNKLSKLDISTLKELKAQYDDMTEVKNQPRYVVKNASLDSSDKSGDDILLQMRGGF